MLRLSTKARYATRIMVYMAQKDPRELAPRQEIANAEGISPDYVEQILIKLKAAGMITSHRGARGGFSIADGAEKSSVADILQAVEGPISLVPCTDEKCTRVSICVTRMVWERATEALKDVFMQTTIEDIAKQAKALNASKSLTFEI